MYKNSSTSDRLNDLTFRVRHSRAVGKGEDARVRRSRRKSPVDREDSAIRKCSRHSALHGLKRRRELVLIDVEGRKFIFVVLSMLVIIDLWRIGGEVNCAIAVSRVDLPIKHNCVTVESLSAKLFRHRAGNPELVFFLAIPMLEILIVWHCNFRRFSSESRFNYLLTLPASEIFSDSIELKINSDMIINFIAPPMITHKALNRN